jgi:hypothetical protein
MHTSPAPTSSDPTSSAPLGPAPAGDRDLFIDLLRAAALGIVVVWHWVFTTVTWHGDGISVDNPVATIGWLWVLTWVAQPMCVFFAVGGHLHSRDSRPARRFWSARLGRLVPPALPLLVVAGVAWVAATRAGWHGVADGVVLAVSPMWFLAVYVVLVALAPAARRAHRRWGWRAVPVLALAVAALDALRLSGRIGGWAVTLAMFILTWGVVHQLGFHLDRFRADRRLAIALAAAGLTGLVVLSGVGPYPAAMVGNSGDAMSNMGPPNLMVVALAAAQLGLLAAFAAPIAAFAARHRDLLAVACARSMPIFVWHLSAYCVFFAAATAVGVDNSTVDGDWWAQRPLWFAGPALVYAGGVALRSRAVASARQHLTEQHRASSRDPSARW